MVLNFLFAMQAAFGVTVAFAMYFATPSFTQLATGHALAPGPTGEIAVIYARLAALGAVLVALVCAAGLASGRRSVRWPCLLALLAVCVLLVLTGLFAVSFQPLKTAIVAFHGVLTVAYVLVAIFLPHEI